MNAIRLCIINSDYEKVFGYMDLMHFTQSLKLVVRLCEQMKVPILAQRVSKYLQDKETKEIFQNQVTENMPESQTSPNKNQSFNIQSSRVGAP
jgi:hypothetical protein